MLVSEKIGNQSPSITIYPIPGYLHHTTEIKIIYLPTLKFILYLYMYKHVSSYLHWSNFRNIKYSQF